ncbi:putative AC transposase [Grifola frondosa]|uniref:Putative AC transposase n=1 Tax=Grifola frondosa TaxID=5627 RepID=A0A1C7MQQ4_GRIFR|nr:putative AC transposase [Grifola frondosa]
MPPPPTLAVPTSSPSDAGPSQSSSAVQDNSPAPPVPNPAAPTMIPSLDAFVAMHSAAKDEPTAATPTDVYYFLLRNHLKKNHLVVYQEAVKRLGLKRSNEHDTRTQHLAHEDFSKKGFLRKLVRWIAADDQSINSVECPEFRELLFLISESYKEEYSAMIRELQNALGRVSFTTDLWSDPNLRAFMGITAYYCMRDEQFRLVVKARLLAFHHVEGRHAGNSLARVFFDILKKAGLLFKRIKQRYENGRTGGLVLQEGISFDHDRNRIRCFPHAVNRAVTAVLDELKKNPRLPIITSSDDAALFKDLESYTDTLEANPVKDTRELVAVCRKSGERRAD